MFLLEGLDGGHSLLNEGKSDWQPGDLTPVPQPSAAKFSELIVSRRRFNAKSTMAKKKEQPNEPSQYTWINGAALAAAAICYGQAHRLENTYIANVGRFGNNLISSYGTSLPYTLARFEPNKYGFP